MTSLKGRLLSGGPLLSGFNRKVKKLTLPVQGAVIFGGGGGDRNFQDSIGREKRFRYVRGTVTSFPVDRYFWDSTVAGQEAALARVRKVSHE